jgi:heme-degrading monooxygenase HmoA
MRDEFERNFLAVSVPYVESKNGYISHMVGYPTKWNPDEYMLLTNWTDEGALIGFAGLDWQKAVIPDGMGKYVAECWVDHFQNQAANKAVKVQNPAAGF